MPGRWETFAIGLGTLRSRFVCLLILLSSLIPTSPSPSPSPHLPRYLLLPSYLYLPVLHRRRKNNSKQVKFAAFCLFMGTSPLCFTSRNRKYILKSKTTANLKTNNLDRHGPRPFAIVCHLHQRPSFLITDYL